jgi:rifampicin phosphotransferase
MGRTWLQGRGVNPGAVSGRVRVVQDPASESPEMCDVLVVRAPTPEVVNHLPLARALVADLGGALAHAVVVARELGLVVVVSAEEASSVLGDGDHVVVDGDSGVITRLQRATSNNSV